MIEWLTSHLTPVLLSSAGAGLAVFAANKILNEASWKKTWRNIGVKLSKTGRSKAGKAFWEPIEKFIQKRINQAVEELNIGLDVDNNVDNSGV